MSRSVVYPQSVLARAGVQPLFGSRNIDATAPDNGDGYREKIAKYVPAETLAFFVPIAAAANTDGLRWVVLVAGALGTLIFTSFRDKVTWYFYIFAVLAFLAWAAGTSDFAQVLLGWSANACKIALGITVFLVPGLDERITRWLTKSP